ncbi:MAG: hypothetical protein HZA66_18095 [Rhodopseudomonas palustris]|uniref:Uncharacterized protein n=1 Tax=Rhodopseudomonas palustris TaxID=1076 RepID=A0A933S041_RHOPL|nr:hypothetical protein [Rhodopseudomonas palustris]
MPGRTALFSVSSIARAVPGFSVRASNYQYNLTNNNSKLHSFATDCSAAEQICFGAWSGADRFDPEALAANSIASAVYSVGTALAAVSSIGSRIEQKTDRDEKEK